MTVAVHDDRRPPACPTRLAVVDALDIDSHATETKKITLLAKQMELAALTASPGVDRSDVALQLGYCRCDKFWNVSNDVAVTYAHRWRVSVRVGDGNRGDRWRLVFGDDSGAWEYIQNILAGDPVIASFGFHAPL